MDDRCARPSRPVFRQPNVHGAPSKWRYGRDLPPRAKTSITSPGASSPSDQQRTIEGRQQGLAFGIAFGRRRVVFDRR